MRERQNERNRERGYALCDDEIQILGDKEIRVIQDKKEIKI